MVAGKQICVLTNVCKSDLAIYKLEPANDTCASVTNCQAARWLLRLRSNSMIVSTWQSI